jgi:hypothetical protein
MSERPLSGPTPPKFDPGRMKRRTPPKKPYLPLQTRTTHRRANLKPSINFSGVIISRGYPMVYAVHVDNFCHKFCKLRNNTRQYQQRPLLYITVDCSRFSLETDPRTNPRDGRNESQTVTGSYTFECRFSFFRLGFRPRDLETVKRILGTLEAKDSPLGSRVPRMVPRIVSRENREGTHSFVLVLLKVCTGGNPQNRFLLQSTVWLIPPANSLQVDFWNLDSVTPNSKVAA